MRRWLLVLALLLPTVLAAQETIPEPGIGPIRTQFRARTLRATACSGDQLIACGNTKSGSLTTDDCVLVDKEYYDGWSFPGTPGQTVTINMSSSNFDTFLILLGPDGIEVDDNDDTATTNSQIIYKIKVAGTYRILATSSKPAVTGSYSLSLACADSGTPNLTPYKPASWSDKIIATLAKDSTAQPATYSPTDSLWFQWAIANNGTGSVDDLSTICGFYIDGVRRGGGSITPGETWPNGYYFTWSHLNLALPAGVHTLTLKVDENQKVSESNESDNEYTRTITIGQGSSGICTPSTTVACLNNRFAVSVAWIANATTGVGTRTSITGDSAWFWFFSANAAELMVKVVDGRAFNGKFWFFYGALSDVQYTITVADVQTGQVKTYTNPQGNLASIADTSAF